MNFLLRLKSWQLFLLFVMPYVLSFVPVAGIILVVISVVAYTGWLYAITTKMHAVIPDKLKPRIGFLKPCCILLACTMSGMFILNAWFGQTAFLLKYPLDMFIPFPFNLVLNFILCRFAGKMLESVIQGRIVYASDAVKAIFFFWFYPIGVWSIQPIVLRVMDKYQ